MRIKNILKCLCFSTNKGYGREHLFTIRIMDPIFSG